MKISFIFFSTASNCIPWNWKLIYLFVEILLSKYDSGICVYLIVNTYLYYRKNKCHIDTIIIIFIFNIRTILKYFLNILFIYFREGKGGRKRGRETSMCGCLSCVPRWGPGLQPRHVPWLGIELVPLWFAGQSSIHWATAARAIHTIIKVSCVYDFYLVKSKKKIPRQSLSLLNVIICSLLMPTRSYSKQLMQLLIHKIN